jgi:YVTN family beta-propeller protein
MSKSTLALLACAGLGLGLVAKETGAFSVLKSTVAIGKQPGGFYLLPTNQLLRPWGEQAIIPGRPVDLTFDSGKRVLAVLNTRSVNLFDGSNGTTLAEIRARSTSYTGIAFRPGDRELWASETTRSGPDSILVAQLNELGMPGKVEHIDLTGHPVPSGIAFSKDGKSVYVAFSRNNSLAVIDADTRTVKREIPVGMAPFGVAVAKGSGKIYVTNRGGRRPATADTTAPSSGSAIVTDPLTGSSTTGSISTIDPETWAATETAVGLAPSALTLSPDEKTLAVNNSHADSVSVIDTASLGRKDVKIPAIPEGTLGSQPIGATFAPDGQTLYIACGGNNSVAILKLDGKNWKVQGALPTGWFPTAIAIDREGSLRVLNIKGVGNTDNHKGSFNSRQYEGSLLKIPPPVAAQVSAGTREVGAANRPVLEPAGGVANLQSLGINHVFVIIK